VLFRGSKALLATILLFNLANLPLFSGAIGSKQILVGHPGSSLRSWRCKSWLRWYWWAC